MTGTSEDSEKKTILIVNDAPILLSLEEKILSAVGYDIHQAEHGGVNVYLGLLHNICSHK